MPRKYLTAAFVDSVKVEKQTEYFDSHTSGLGLRVSPGGTKTFFYRYNYNGKKRRFSINRFSKAFTLSDARFEVNRLRSEIRDGADPQGERVAKKEEQEDLSFKDFSETYDAIHLNSLRETTQEYHKWVISSKVMPYLGKRSLTEIKREDIIKILDRVAIKDDAQATANKVRSRLHHMFEFAISRGYLNENPVSATKPYKGGYNKRERYYSSDEIKSIWETATEKLAEPVQSYIKIITLTGQRRTETHQMKWENIQFLENEKFKGWVWKIPKEMAKSDRDHEVQLSDTAINIIRGLKDRAGNNPFVFASYALDDIPIGLKTIKRAVKTIKDESEVDDFRLHDMRRTISTWLAEMGVAQEVVSKILNHSSGAGGSLATIYNRYEYRSERQRALQKWDHRLEQIIAGKSKVRIHKIGG